VDEPLYDIDKDTRELLEDCLGLAQRVVDLQYDDEVADDFQEMLKECARRFGIATSTVYMEQDGDTVMLTFAPSEEAKPKPRWTPTVIDGDRPE
jgi:hypothetical protein